jgi:hypothetical protein
MLKLVHSSNHEAWLAARRLYLCSSEAAAALGENPYMQRAQLVMEKAGLSEPWTGNEQTLLEPGSGEAAKEKWGWQIEPMGWLVRDEVSPYLAATPDFVAYTPWGKCAVQTKVTCSAAQEDCKQTRRDGTPSTAAYAFGAPVHYQLQQMAELACLGPDWEWSALLVCHGCPPGWKLRSYLARRHEGVIRRIRGEAERFMRDVEALREGKLRAS